MVQIPLLSFEYLIDDDPNLTEKDNFSRKKNAGDIIVLGGRLFGKSWTVEKLDFLIYTFHAENEPAGFTSFIINIYSTCWMKWLMFGIDIQL